MNVRFKDGFEIDDFFTPKQLAKDQGPINAIVPGVTNVNKDIFSQVYFTMFSFCRSIWRNVIALQN